MYSKTYPPCTPREKLTSTIFDSNVTKRLNLAQQKLRPVIDELMRAATDNSKVKSINNSYYVTVQQFEDAISAYRILKEVDKALSKKKNSKYTKQPYNLNTFDLERRDVQVNKFGKIFVDTSILIQLIELQKILGDIISARESYSDNDFLKYVSSSQECSSSTENNNRKGKDTSNDKFKVTYMRKNNSKPKIKINILESKSIDPKAKIKQEIFSFGQSGKTFVVMPAEQGSSGISQKDREGHNRPLSTLPEERVTNSETNLSASRRTSRKIKSTGSLESDDQHVTNVVGARKIILNCLYDLSRVRSFLERTDLSAEVQIQSAILDNNPDTDRPPSVDERRSSHGQRGSQVHEDSGSHESAQLNVHEDDQTSQGHQRSQENKHPSSKISVTDKREGHRPSQENIHPSSKRSVTDKREGHRRSQENIHPSSKRSVTDKQDECCCGSTYASEVPMELVLDAGDDNASKLIICIKGKTEEEGDVQIVIRQCSECKNVGGKDSGGQKDIHDDSSTGRGKDLRDDSTTGGSLAGQSTGGLNVAFDPQHPADSIVTPASDIADTTSTHRRADQESQPSDSSHRRSQQLQNGRPPADDIGRRTVSFDGGPPSVQSTKSDEFVELEESDVTDEPSSGEKSQNQKTDASAETDKPGIHVLFDPDDPSRSIVEPHKIQGTDSADTKSQEDQSARVHRKPMRTGSCSKIELYETTNLCLTTDNGQELVISLTVRPKVDGVQPEINLKDIFSESTTLVEPNKASDNIFGSEPEFTVEVQDDFIPLSRTKVCSSLNFDVALMETKMEHKGIQHVNQGIVVRLQELGVSNLLRACRPVKCGRPAVLNEKSRKGLPYSASLTSLPLEKSDIPIIEQSMKMSFNKLKYLSGKSKNNALAYLMQLGDVADNVNFRKNIQITFVRVRQPHYYNYKSADYQISKKLNYYINLVHDVEDGYKKRACQVYFFEIKKYHNSDVSEEPTRSLLEGRKPVKDKKSESNKQNLITLKNRIQQSIYYPPGSSLLKSSVKACPGKETPTLLSKENLEYVDSDDSQRENKTSVKSLESSLQGSQQNSSKQKMKFSSKIPVYKYSPRNRNFSQQDLYTDSVSVKSLPQEKEDVDNVRDYVQISGNKSKTNSTPREFDGNSKSLVKRTNSDLEIIDTFKKASDDSLELYFNSFFRDKYFSKIALSQKQSSCRSFKLRKKKFTYNFSRSHSQTCFGEFNVEGCSTSSIATNQPGNEKMDMHRDNPSEIRVTKLNDSSSSVATYFTRMFDDFQIDENVTRNKQTDGKHDTSVKSLSSYVDMLESEVLQDLFHGMKNAKVVEETTYRLSEYLSQPNVEAGMDLEDSSTQMHSLNSLMSFTRDQRGRDVMRIINKCGTTAVANAFDKDPYYLVYQYSFMQKLIDKSRDLFKYCKRDRNECSDRMGAGSSVLDTCRCKSRFENPEDTRKYFKPQHTSSILSLNELEMTKDGKVCPNCGCVIDKCRSKMAGDNCACFPQEKPQVCKKERKKNESCQGEPLKRRKPPNHSKKKSTRPHKRTVGIICAPQGVNMSTNARLVGGKPGKNCHCVKCDKRSKDGSCFCSHCLGVFDKSVGIKPRNKEVGVQCGCDMFSHYETVACKAMSKMEDTPTKESAKISTSKAEDGGHSGENQTLKSTEAQEGGSEQPNTPETIAEDPVPKSIEENTQPDITHDEHVSYVHVKHDFTRKLSGRLYSKIPADFYGEYLSATKKHAKIKQ